MLHVDAQRLKAEIRINEDRMEAKIVAAWRDFQTQLKEIEAGAERGRGPGTGSGVAKPPKFDRNT
jgi:hypothetical protein